MFETKNKFSLGISPCPNDTFIFYALIHQKINTKGLTFDIQYNDVQELNKLFFNNTLDITKLSFFAYFNNIQNYILLDSGAALGNGCGPLIIAKNKISIEDIDNKSIAIPGKNTTAYFLLKYAFPAIHNIEEVVFSEIEDYVLSSKTDLGLIIHENRFTYQNKGLNKVIDLGEYWEEKTNLPIPLGGIAIKRDIPYSQQILINELIVKSIEYAYAHIDEVLDFCSQYAQEIDRNVMLQHINLYVNKYSLSLQEEGRKAIHYMYNYIHSNHKNEMKIII